MARCSGEKPTDLYPAVIAVNKEYIAVDINGLSVYRRDSGEFLWSDSICSGSLEAYFSDNKIIIPCYGYLAKDAASGETLWQSELITFRQSAFDDGIVYSSLNPNEIGAYDTGERKYLWITQFDNNSNERFKVYGNFLTILNKGRLCVFQRDDGKIQWCVTDLFAAHDPMLYQDAIYLYNGFRSGITAYDLQDGAETGRLDFPMYYLSMVENYNPQIASSDELLVFTSGRWIYGYGK